MIGDLDPDGRVIARLLPTAHVTVHVGIGQAGRELRADQQMVDAEPGIPGIGVP
jgi:hypothetical protein